MLQLAILWNVSSLAEDTIAYKRMHECILLDIFRGRFNCTILELQVIVNCNVLSSVIEHT